MLKNIKATYEIRCDIPGCKSNFLVNVGTDELIWEVVKRELQSRNWFTLNGDRSVVCQLQHPQK